MIALQRCSMFIAFLVQVQILLLHVTSTSTTTVHRISIPLLSFQHSAESKHRAGLLIRGGQYPDSDHALQDDSDDPEYVEEPRAIIEVSGAPSFLLLLNGIYSQTAWKVNNRAHYERPVQSNKPHGKKLHLAWSGSQWTIRYSIESQHPDSEEDVLAHATIRTLDPRKTGKFWFVKQQKTFRSCPQMKIQSTSSTSISTQTEPLPHTSADVIDSYSIGSSSRSRSGSTSNINRHLHSFRGSSSGGNGITSRGVNPDVNVGTEDGISRGSALKAGALLPARKHKEVLGVPRIVFPHFLAFMADAVAVGIAMPLLPFFVMELGANALQLSLVVSANYAAQMVGCIVMGRVSDAYGRRIVLIMCLAANSLSYFFVSRAKTLQAVAIARIISGAFGGLLPVMQSSVADSSVLEERPKYLGRIMATFGMGFVIGPAISAAMGSLPSRRKIQVAGAFPLLGLIVAVLFAKETKRNVRGPFVRKKVTSLRAAVGEQGSTYPSTDSSSSGSNSGSDSYRYTSDSSSSGSGNGNTGFEDIQDDVEESSDTDSATAAAAATALPHPLTVVAPLRSEVIALVLNGFLIMYAFATETIYAMFLKDAFGYGENVLSKVFALNGLMMGIFQVLFIKPLINTLGKHATLVLGNILLGMGMAGLALARKPVIHFMMFALHIIGYSIADTALVSLISRYSAESSQGRDLALNQAAQSCARIFSPLCAGVLYEFSKQPNGLLPTGALPFLAGGLCPAVAVLVPSLLYLRSVSRKHLIRNAATTSPATMHTMHRDEVESNESMLQGVFNAAAQKEEEEGNELLRSSTDVSQLADRSGKKKGQKRTSKK